MSEDLLPVAITQIGLAITGLIGWTGVHIAERIPSKWKLSKASTRLRALETLVRRLILLMALEIELAPKPQRPDRATTSPFNDPENPNENRDGVELVRFPKVRQYSLSLMPPLAEFTEGADLSHLSRAPTPIHISVRRFSRRINALRHVLDTPEAHAKRLARSLQRRAKPGELSPIVMAAPLPPGLSPELGLLNGGLALQLRSAIRAWKPPPPDP